MRDDPYEMDGVVPQINILFSVRDESLWTEKSADAVEAEKLEDISIMKVLSVSVLYVRLNIQLDNSSCLDPICRVER